MTENGKLPREFIVEHARNGAVIVTDREDGEILGGYQDRFEALSAIASDWGFSIERGSEGMAQAMGHGFHPPAVEDVQVIHWRPSNWPNPEAPE